MTLVSRAQAPGTANRSTPLAGLPASGDAALGESRPNSERGALRPPPGGSDLGVRRRFRVVVPFAVTAEEIDLVVQHLEAQLASERRVVRDHASRLTGRVTVKVVPVPSLLVTSMRPP